MQKNTEILPFLISKNSWGGGVPSMPTVNHGCPCCSCGEMKCSATCCPRAPACARPCRLTNCHAPTCPTRFCSPSFKPPPCSPPRFCRWKNSVSNCKGACGSGCCTSTWDCCNTPNACYRQLCYTSSCCDRICGF